MKQSLILHGKTLNVMVIPSVLNYSGMLIGNQKKKKNAGCPFSRLLSTLFIILFPSLQFFLSYFWEYCVPKRLATF